MGEWMYRCFLDLFTSWRWVVSFTPRPLYPRGKSLQYPLDRKLSGPQSPWRSENSWPHRDPNSDLSVVQPVASRYTDCAIPDPLLYQWDMLNIWSMELIEMTFKSSVRSSQEILRLRYKAQPVNAVRETVAVYCENHTEHTNALCGWWSEFCFTEGRSYNHRRYLKR
jgi:hypothetical protein